MPATLESRPAPTTVGSHFVSNYPPFSCWTADEIPKLEAALDRPVAPAEPISLYLHVPFCRLLPAFYLPRHQGVRYS